VIESFFRCASNAVAGAATNLAAGMSPPQISRSVCSDWCITTNKEKSMTRRILIVSSALISAATGAGIAQAQQYQTEVIATGLQNPTGIAVNAQGDVFFTELPTPGVPGSMGGMNSVSMRDAITGEITAISEGEPEPTHIDVTRAGELFWTCKSAGVILKHVNDTTSLVVSGLDHPSGIAVKDVGKNRGDIYFTQLPTPGVPGSMGGENTVSRLRHGKITDLSTGEPEPTDIAVDRHGNLYWTCKSAGVILTRKNSTGQVSLLLGDLNSPSGIALDEVGNLYFTEVPTPGVPGSMGGENAVWKLHLDTMTLSLIDDGDPEPTDVAVSPSGQNVYWTCTSAGVIVRATFAP
jgi:DNA-binding beta-propeller fold protein YncE